VSWTGLTPTARQSGPVKGRGKKGRGNTYAKRIATVEVALPPGSPDAWQPEARAKNGLCPKGAKVSDTIGNVGQHHAGRLATVEVVHICLQRKIGESLRGN
jgi:hypothetical protein